MADLKTIAVYYKRDTELVYDPRDMEFENFHGVTQAEFRKRYFVITHVKDNHRRHTHIPESCIALVEETYNVPVPANETDNVWVLAEAAYNAYRTQSKGKSLVSGATLPEWKDVPDDIKEAWRKASSAVYLLVPLKS